jgi:uncharacterized damage-inducible protein DinB
MKETAMYAQYNQAGNKTIYDIVSKMSNDEREKDRGSYYGSLSGLVRHLFGGTRFFMSMFKETLAGNASASKAIAALDNVPFPEEGSLNEAQWQELGANMKKADAAYLAMAEALTSADLSLPVKVEWYNGSPATVPLSFMLSQLLVHNTHHRGQISQVLDSLKIDNDYSGINVAFLKP